MTSGEHVSHPAANDNESLRTGVVFRGPPVTIEVGETFVNVTFHQAAQRYHFGRLADADDIARFGPLSRREQDNRAGKGDYAYDHLESLAYTLALRAIVI